VSSPSSRGIRTGQQQENGEKFATVEAALDSFKEMFQALGRQWPIVVTGRAYDEAGFVKEVDRLLEEGRRLAWEGNRIALIAAEADREAQHVGVRLQLYRSTLGTFEALKLLLPKPPSSTDVRMLESQEAARERLTQIEKPWDTADHRSDWVRMQAESRKSRLTATECLGRTPESRK
jgi:hypothetical protein